MFFEYLNVVSVLILSYYCSPSKPLNFEAHVAPLLLNIYILLSDFRNIFDIFQTIKNINLQHINPIPNHKVIGYKNQ